MAITINEIAKFLDDNKIHYTLDESGKLVMGFTTPTFCDCDDGEKHMLVVISLEENGEYFKCFAPLAFKAVGEHKRALLEACMSVQWHTKLVQFEYDSTDGEIRPIIEFPIEDGTLTAKQVVRCIHALVQIVDDSYTALDKAIKTGEVDFSKTGAARARVSSLIANLKDMVTSGMLTTEQAEELARILQTEGDNKAPESL